jgi:hypothetical protein
VELPAADALQKVTEQAKSEPQLADYIASAAPRVIPVFAIHRV